jgi:hypothetical protein
MHIHDDVMLHGLNKGAAMGGVLKGPLFPCEHSTVRVCRASRLQNVLNLSALWKLSRPKNERVKELCARGRQVAVILCGAMPAGSHGAEDDRRGLQKRVLPFRKRSP